MENAIKYEMCYPLFAYSGLKGFQVESFRYSYQLLIISTTTMLINI